MIDAYCSNIKGAILERGINQYTKLSLFLPIIKERAIYYNWLLTDIDSDYSSNIVENDYEFLTGEEFLELIEKQDITFACGVFLAIPKKIPFDKIILEPLPYANGYVGFWKNPLSIQNPQAIIEMVLWDGELALIISRDDEIVNDFLVYYSLSEDLEVHNGRNIFTTKL